MIGDNKIGLVSTVEGGFGRYFINKTGAVSVKGTLVNTEASSDNAVAIVDHLSDEPDIIGVIYTSGVPDGSMVLVVLGGVADVLLEDGTAATRGYWARTSLIQSGRANMTYAEPPGGTINAIEAHFREIGHCMESKGPGVNVLARAVIHFN